MSSRAPWKKTILEIITRPIDRHRAEMGCTGEFENCDKDDLTCPYYEECYDAREIIPCPGCLEVDIHGSEHSLCEKCRRRKA